jgi:pimeloyl-ACP methyl ester carboxylesterase
VQTQVDEGHVGHSRRPAQRRIGTNGCLESRDDKAPVTQAMTSALVRVFGVLLLLTALALPLLYAPDRPVESLIQRWAPPPSDLIEVKGQLVHLRDEGPRADTSPIVLLHGTSASLHTWEGWARALRGQRRVISLDLPGFGLSGPWSGEYAQARYDGATWARFTLDVLDTLGVRHFVVGGNSLGGEVAWRLARLAPQRVDKLILVDAGGYAFEPESVPLGWRIAQLPAAAWLGQYLLPRALVAQGLDAVYGDPAKVSAALVDRYWELTLREGNRAALTQRMRSLDRGADAAQIATLRLPTLIVWGGRDRVIPRAFAERFAHDIPGSTVVTFDDLGHVPQEEDPARSVAPVKAFLGLAP